MDEIRHAEAADLTGVSGRESRFLELYNRTAPAIQQYAQRRLLAGAGDAGDVTAEVFGVAWRRLEDVPPAPHDRLWLFGVARRVVARHRRATARRVRLAERLSSTPDNPPAGEQPEGATEIGTEVLGALRKLRPGDREVLMLVAWEGLTHAEVAEVLGCSINAVAIRVHRAKQRLRQELGLALPTVRAERLSPARLSAVEPDPR